MPKPPPNAVPLTSVPRSAAASPAVSLQLPSERLRRQPNDFGETAGSSRGSSSDLEHLSKEVSRQGSPFAEIPYPERHRDRDRERGWSDSRETSGEEEGSGVVVWDAEADDNERDDPDMPSDLRPSMEEVKSSHHQPLLASDKYRQSYDDTRPNISRRSSRFRERDAEAEAHKATRKRYTIAGMFLLVSLVSFIVQTETAVYIQHNLKWNKAYCMLFV